MVRGLHPTTLEKLGSLTAIALGDRWPERFFYVIGINNANAMGEVEETDRGQAAQKFARDPARRLPFNTRFAMRRRGTILAPAAFCS